MSSRRSSVFGQGVHGELQIMAQTAYRVTLDVRIVIVLAEAVRVVDDVHAGTQSKLSEGDPGFEVGPAGHDRRWQKAGGNSHRIG